MRHARPIVLVAAMVLAGCVTTEITGKFPVADPEEAAAINLELGIAYIRQGNYELARIKLERAVDANSELAMAHSALGLVYERMGDNDAAEREYRRAVRLEGKNPDTLNSLAVFLCLQKNEPEDAMRYFDKALEDRLYSNRTMIYTNAGVCARKTDLEQAENYLRSALARDPRSGEVLLQLSDIAYQRGNYLQSRGFLERHIALAGVNPSVLWLGVQVETALGDVNAAEGYGEQLKGEFPTSLETRWLLDRERNAG